VIWRGLKLLVVGVLGFVLPGIALLIVNIILREGVNLDLPGGLIVDLLFAAAVYFGVAVLWFWLCWRRGRRVLIAGGVATVAFIVGFPLAAWALRAQEKVGPSGPLPSRLDVVIVTSGVTDRVAPPAVPRPDPPLWDVHYSVGRAVGGTVVWELLDSDSAQKALEALATDGDALDGRPSLRPGGDAVLLLDPDAAPPVTPAPAQIPERDAGPGEVERWKAMVGHAELNGLPAFALLRSEDEDRLAAWRAWVGATGGDAISLQQLGQRSVTDAAIQLGADAPSSDADLALAYKHRPLLFFDHGERQGDPMDVDSFLAGGRVELCNDGGGCEPVTRASQLRNGRTHLRIPRRSAAERRRFALADEPSRIYVHVTHAPDEPGLAVLDYWWYLPYNDNPVARKGFCGPGFTVAGVTCHEHVSDWEGITVEVDTRSPEPLPTKVRYAQHANVAEYDWPALRTLWGSSNYIGLTAGIDDAGARPIVLVARGSHASYPNVCGGGCEQPAVHLPEGPHDGAQPWSENTDAACALTCVSPTPVRARGTAAALWNAYEGPWGDRHCLLLVWCDVGSAPTAPAAQERYRDPRHLDVRPALPRVARRKDV
jgi:hypothetical protein